MQGSAAMLLSKNQSIYNGTKQCPPRNHQLNPKFIIRTLLPLNSKTRKALLYPQSDFFKFTIATGASTGLGVIMSVLRSRTVVQKLEHYVVVGVMGREGSIPKEVIMGMQQSGDLFRLGHADGAKNTSDRIEKCHR